MSSQPRGAPPFLSQVPLPQARASWFAAIAAAGAGHPRDPEVIPVAEALGRVLARPAMARFSSPSYHACAMDGYAVAASDTYGAAETNPLQLAVNVKAHYVDTGDPLPPGTDAVIMIEDVQEVSGGAIELRAAATPWQHVRPVGEDIAAGEMLLPAAWRLRGPDLAVLAAAGVSAVPVHPRPLVAVIPTGDEIVPLTAVGATGPAAGEIIESNSLLVSGVAAEVGADVEVTPVVPDEPGLIRAAVAAALVRADIVVLSAGSSAGSGDFAAGVLRELGEVVVHGVATRPGKPVILAVCGGKPVLGMPGYPVSAYLALDNFLRPLLQTMLGLPTGSSERITARIARRMASPVGVREYLRVKLGRVGGAYVAAPLTRGAGVLTSLVRADGMVEIPEDREGYEAGNEVAVTLLRPREEIDRTVVHIGSHDLALDVLGDIFRRSHPGSSLSSANAGSLAGLQALARGEAHVAGTHLLDETSGEYNASYVRRMMPGRRVALVGLVSRQQGLIVARGNPLGITGVADLVRLGIRYINRQRGAGTRVLLDYLLREAGLDAALIEGYRREVYTHLGVAAEVAAGGADAGMGIQAAAAAAGLDFVPVAAERYELAVPAETLSDPVVASLLAVAAGDEFREAVGKLAGYGVVPAGELRWVDAGAPGETI